MRFHVIRRLLKPVPVVYVTRFNIAVRFGTGSRPPVHLDPAWLEERIALFERYCVAKMAAQTDQRYRWLLLVSPGTDAAIVRRLERAPNAEVVQVAPESPLGPLVAGRVAGLGESIITARLDSDDQLSTTFTQALREIAWHDRRRFAVYFTKGLQLDASSGAYYVKMSPFNQFPAVLERSAARDFVTVHASRHNTLFDAMDVRLIRNKRPMWCTIVHGGNALNTINGRPADPPPADW